MDSPNRDLPFFAFQDNTNLKIKTCRDACYNNHHTYAPNLFRFYSIYFSLFVVGDTKFYVTVMLVCKMEMSAGVGTATENKDQPQCMNATSHALVIALKPVALRMSLSSPALSSLSLHNHFFH